MAKVWIMAQSAITVRIDSELKSQFDKLCEQFGMSVNTAFNIFFFFAIEAFENMCKTARENNIEMSLDEINAEIQAARDERRKRQTSL